MEKRYYNFIYSVDCSYIHLDNSSEIFLAHLLLISLKDGRRAESLKDFRFRYPQVRI